MRVRFCSWARGPFVGIFVGIGIFTVGIDVGREIGQWRLRIRLAGQQNQVRE
jgi:hypothetical protein